MERTVRLAQAPKTRPRARRIAAPGSLAALRPGLHGPDHRAAFLAAGRLYGLGGPLQRRCGATTRQGTACRQPALRGQERCHVHAGLALAGRRFTRRAEALSVGDATPAQVERAAARAASARLRSIWRRDPWAVGITLDLGECESQFRARLRADGFSADRLAPAVADWMRWKWRRAFHDTAEDWPTWNAALAQLPARVAAAGPVPAGFDWDWRAFYVGAAYRLPARLPRSSRRAEPV